MGVWLSVMVVVDLVLAVWLWYSTQETKYWFGEFRQAQSLVGEHAVQGEKLYKDLIKIRGKEIERLNAGWEEERNELMKIRREYTDAAAGRHPLVGKWVAFETYQEMSKRAMAAEQQLERVRDAEQEKAMDPILHPAAPTWTADLDPAKMMADATRETAKLIASGRVSDDYTSPPIPNVALELLTDPLSPVSPLLHPSAASA